MKLTVVYICVAQGIKTLDFASRFISTYLAFAGGVEHDLLVVSNGGPLSTETGLLFKSLPRCKFLPRPNHGGWDISAYIDVARGPGADSDFLICCGESVYFHRAGWLSRFMEAVEAHGPGMYGSLSSGVVRLHLNTTGFVTTPDLLADYPRQVRSREERFEFEHGQFSFWKHVRAKGRPVKLVTWDGIYDPYQWRQPPNILWRGDQSNCLVWCRHTDAYEDADEARKLNWSTSIDNLKE